MSLPQPNHTGPRCPHCAMPVYFAATRCASCTGEIDRPELGSFWTAVALIGFVVLIIWTNWFQ